MSVNILCEKICTLKNPTVVGLDPMLEYIPESFREGVLAQYGNSLEGATQAVLAYNKALIDALYDIVPAVKPQSAYYERLGWQGVKVLYETVEYAKKRGMYVILDGKRNDIGSTASAYATAYLGTVDVGGTVCEPFGADALTVSPYLGSDGVAPFVKLCEENKRMIFVLVKTSNKSSGELQDLICGDMPIYERMGNYVSEWGKSLCGKDGYSEVGAVVGATYPQQLAELRAKFPSVFFLVPGYGAQGGTAKDIAGAFDKNGLGAIINSSRKILCAWKEAKTDDFADAARKEAIRMRDEIMSAI